MQPTNNSKRFFISIGALLIAGLFFIGKNQAENFPNLNNKLKNTLKPSQLNFTGGNQLPQTESSAESTTPPLPSPPENEVDPRMTALDEILKTNNDNDPRLDAELKNLPVNFHFRLYEKYQKLAPENRNGRGLLVFLISRDIKSVEDLEFLQKVYQEEPCLGLADCKRSDPDDSHNSGTNQTTLNYPQMAGLYQIEQQITRNPEVLKNPNMRTSFLTILKTAENFPVPIIQEKAAQIRKKFGL